MDTFELAPGTEYTVQLVSVAMSRQGLNKAQESSLIRFKREESKAVESCFVLPPEPPANLQLEAATTASLKLKWQDPQEHVNQSYIVSVKGQGARCKWIEDITIDTNYVNISKLESGQVYHVSVVTSINVAEKNYCSSQVTR